MMDGYKKSVLGDIPVEWEVVKIEDFLEGFRGGASLKPSDFIDKNGFEVIPKKAIISGGKLSLDYNNPTYCSYHFAEANSNHIIDKEYIVTTLRDLVPTAPSIGYMVHFNTKKSYILAQGVYGFKISQKIDRTFLIQYSNTSQFRKVMQTI